MKTELNKISTIADGEIKLFRNMSTILAKKYSVAFIEETHQQYVDYHSTQVNQTATREISDLWIIAFSPNNNRARMTFLQAKYHRGILDKSHTVFSGDYFQYELLSTRPALTASSKKYNFPSDILSFSCCGSVGSYGVFYIDKNNHVDLAYCTASYLTTNTSLPKKYAGYRVDLDIPYSSIPKTSSCSCNSCTELISCFDIDHYVQSTLNMEIGAEITLYPSILSFVRKLLNQVTGNTTVTQFISFIDGNQPPGGAGDDAAAPDGLPCSILLINTDAIEGERRREE